MRRSESGDRRPRAWARALGDSAARNRGCSRQRAPGALLLRLFPGQELLDGGEHHAARLHREPGAEVRAARRLHGGLAQQVGAAREGGEELVVEAVAVGQHDDGGVLHRRLADDAPRVEGHGQALARALGVPDDADAPVPRRAAGAAARLAAARLLADHQIPGRRPLKLRRAQGLGDGGFDRVELVVARHLLDQRPAPAFGASVGSPGPATAAATTTPAAAAATVLEHDEISDEGQEAARRTHAPENHPQLGQVRTGGPRAGDRGPGA